MIDHKTAAQFARKFHGMPMTPTGPDGEAKRQIELRIDALERKARSVAHAGAVAAHLIDTLTYYPTVAEIVNACEYVEDPSGAQAIARSRECPHCGGDGWRTVEGPHGTSAAYPCDHTGQGNTRMGVAMSPAVAEHYRQEAVAADRRRDMVAA